MPLPDPMLARPGQLPTQPGWSFEPKWDGLRAIVRTGDNFTIRSRRGWVMTELLPELASIPISGVFDGELVAFGNDDKPSFPRICQRILGRDVSVPVALVLFDVLELDSEETLRLPYRRRREILEGLDFAGVYQLCPSFDDGPALWHAVKEHGLEGVMAKRLDETYRPGERTWIKQKNPQWPRYAAEREAAARERRHRRLRDAGHSPGASVAPYLWWWS